MKDYSAIKSTVSCARGKEPCDRVIENVRLVNVYSEEIQPADIHIKGSWIVSTDPDPGLSASTRIDGEGLFALPGFLDTHVHYETTLLTPERIAEVVVPQGTTTLFADPMEIANVSGVEGIQAMLASISRLPFRTFIEVSSRVPTAPGLETTGAVLGLDEVAEVLSWEQSVSLGELDPGKILLSEDEQYLRKVAEALQQRKIVNGHAIGREGAELTAYASAGISDDHECVTFDELLERIRRGMAVMVREGSSERNTERLIRGVLENDLSCEHLMFCSDDKHPQDILEDGHINENVNKAIGLGLDPMKAIKMATLNAARHFHLEGELGSLTPGRRADILLVDDLEQIHPSRVFFEGSEVSVGGDLTVCAPRSDYPDWIRRTVSVSDSVSPERFQIRAGSDMDHVDVNVIELIEDQIINKWTTERATVKQGLIQSAPESDLLKIGVVERHGKSGNTACGFVRGFGLDSGAIASTVAHDHHNIVVVGTNDRDMHRCVEALVEMQGGFVAVDHGEIIGERALPIGGLMTDEAARSVIESMQSINRKVAKMGSTLDAPFMTLSFVSLPTVPELGITDMGLIDVLQQELIPVERQTGSLDSP